MENAKIIHLRGPNWFQGLVQERSVDTENVILTDHARLRMDERAITLEDVIQVLRRGRCREAPSLSNNRQDYRGKMDAMVAGREVVVVAAVSVGQPQLVVVTVW